MPSTSRPVLLACRQLALALVVAVLAASGVVVGAGWYHAVAQEAAGEDSSFPEPVGDPLPTFPTDESDPAWQGVEVPPIGPGSVEVEVPAEGLVRVGDYPLMVGATEEGSPGRVLVTVLDDGAAELLGASILAFQVSRTDGEPFPGRVKVAVDYSSFSRKYGGDFATRLVLEQLPGCAVEQPANQTCLTVTGLEETNDLDVQRLVGDIPVGPDLVAPGGGTRAGVTRVSSGAGGSAGDFGASPLSASDEWSVGPHTGTFSYSYDLPMPPAVAGPVPALALTYSSQSVDARTPSQNSQPSQVGEGWSFGAGSIERRFRPCAQDGAEYEAYADFCQGPAEFFLSLNGQASELVRQSSNLWRLRDDPAWRVQSLTGAANGANGGDYWIVTTPDGARYWFGLGTEPRSNLATNSAYNVTVFGDDPGERCYNASGGFLASYCPQTWRWNLDRIEDTRGNVASLFYTKEVNRYARNGNPNTTSQYDRGGWLTKVEYSKRNGAEGTTAPTRVIVSVAERCYALSNCPALATAPKESYPDVPLDLYCMDAGNCPKAGMKAPSFWSTKRITRIETFIADPTYKPLDRVDFAHEFPETGEDAVGAALWLKSIQRTGLRSSPPVVLPAVALGGMMFANRVDHDSPTVPATYKARLLSVINETGGQLVVAYGRPRPCNPDALPIPWDTNTLDCFPQFFTPYGGAAGSGAFNKYHVTRVERRDLAAGTPAMITNYVYRDGNAWHHDDSLVTPGNSQSWSDYRGHSDVEVRTGADVNAPVTRTRYRTFRGMQGDRRTDGSARAASLTDVDGVVHTDLHYLAGRPLETLDLLPLPGDTPATKTQHRYWATQTAAGPAGTTSIPHNAQFVREANTFRQFRNTAPGAPEAWQMHRVDTVYDPAYGLVESSLDRGADLAGTADDICTVPLRTSNASAWILDPVNRVETFQGGCAGTRIGRVDTYYDNSADRTLAPSVGNVTARSAWASPTSTSTTRMTYDTLGRVTSVQSPNHDQTALKTTTQYVHPSGYPYPTSVIETAPLVDGVVRVQTTAGRFLDIPGEVTDIHGGKTTPVYDALGRIRSLRKPVDPTGPSLTFDYQVFQNAPSLTWNRPFTSPTAYIDTFVYTDGWGREVQRQVKAPDYTEEVPRRVVTNTRYDALGNVVGVSDALARSGHAGYSGYLPIGAGSIEREQRYSYDSLNRRTSVEQWHNGVTKLWQTQTKHYGFTTQVVSPVRGLVTQEHDALGRTKTIDEAHDGSTITTRHAYTPRGELESVTDTDGNVVSYGYDWLGRRVTSDDPDQGDWTYTYDKNGNVLTVTDGNATTTTTTYDALDRKTSQTAPAVTVDVGGGTAPTAPPVAATWNYDTASLGSGRLASSTRDYGGGKTITQAVTAYDGRGRVTGKQTVIGGGFPGGIAGTFAYAYDHDIADRPRSITYPAAGGLAAEMLVPTYVPFGLPDTLTGYTTGGSPTITNVYVAKSYYQPDGRLQGSDLGVASGTGSSSVVAARRYTYDAPTGRLATTQTTVSRALAAPVVEESTTYSYDAESNVTAVHDGAPGVNQAECFGYDDLNRLDVAFTRAGSCGSATAGDGALPAPYDHTYAYDDLGNLTESVDRQAAPDVVTTHTPHATKPHALGSVSGPDAFVATYDGNGAMGRRAGTGGATTHRFAFDATHQLARVVRGASTEDYFYDADGARVVRVDDGGTYTLFLDGTEVVLTGAGPARATRFYNGVAVRTEVGDAASTGMWWTVSNGQNSVSLSVKADVPAGTVRRQRYLPYGGHRTEGGLPGSRDFLGKTRDPSKLVHLGARHYDPSIGRFLTVDPIVNAAEPQSLNGYTYARGNPTSLVDPAGLEPFKTSDPKAPWAGMGCGGKWTCGTKSPGQRYEELFEGVDGSSISVVPYHQQGPLAPGTMRAMAPSPVTCSTTDFLRAVGKRPPSWSDVGGAAADLVFDVDACGGGFSASCALEVGGILPIGKAMKGVGKLTKWGKRLFRAEKAANSVDDLARVGFRPDTSHIFRNATGHLAQDTAENRALIQSALDPGNLRTTVTLNDGSTLAKYFKTLPDGTQVWAEVRRGQISNGGLNVIPR